MQSYTSPDHCHLVILALQDHLGLADLEILIVAINNGILWAAGPDEANALGSEQIN